MKYNIANHRYATRRKINILNATRIIQTKFRGKLAQNKLFRLTKYKTCSICLENIYFYNCTFLKNCDHIFHKRCIVKWLCYENNCPNCRTEITQNSRSKLSRLMESIHHIIRAHTL